MTNKLQSCDATISLLVEHLWRAMLFDADDVRLV
jgi:hypothetical protein